jgi:Ca2+-binding EF-hand superfamily protein/membrane protein implicated in regulation of membrane protease activity
MLQDPPKGIYVDGTFQFLTNPTLLRLPPQFQWLARIAAWGMVLLHIYERPTWTYQSSRGDNWRDSDQYPSFNLTYLNPVALNLLNLACLAVLWWIVSMEFGYKRFTRNVNLVYIGSFVLTVKTITVLGCLVQLALHEHPTFSAAPIEVVMCLLVEQQFDNNVGSLQRTLPKFTTLMLPLAGVVCAYTALGFLIFNPNSQEAMEYFPTFGTGYWYMLMILNASSWPGPMLPSLRDNRAYCIYFYVYIMIAAWGLLNLVLGFVYLFFQQEEQRIYETQEKSRLDNRAAAFRLLDEERKGYLTYSQADLLLREMYDCYESARPRPSAEERYELILVLDIQNNYMIDETDFSYIEQKCYSRALKTLRAKKRKFTRYVSAAILRERLYASNNAEEGARGEGATVQSAAGTMAGSLAAILSPLRDVSSDKTSPSLSQSLLEAGDSRSHSDDESLARTDAEALARRVGFVDTSFRSGNHSVASAESSGKERDGRLSSAIDAAVLYAGHIEDPKLIDLYRSIQTTALMQQNHSGPTMAQRVAYVSLQLDSIYFDISLDCFMLLVGIGVLFNPQSTDLAHFYTAVALLEMIVKLSVKGRHRYWRSTRTSVDGVVAVGLLVLTIADACLKGRAYSLVGTKALVLLRTLAFPRNVLATNGFKAFRARHRVAFEFAFHGASHFTFLLLVLVVMIYFFAGLGQHIFGGAICLSGPGADAVASSLYGQDQYYPQNFNDMPSGMVTMFMLLSVNNMHVTASGFVAAYSQWAELFFALWYALGVLLLLNILTAVFVKQYTGYISHMAVEQEAAEKEAELINEDDEASPSKEDGDGKVDTVDVSDEARRNAALNAGSGAGGAKASQSAGARGTVTSTEEEDFIGVPDSTLPQGTPLFVAPVLPSMPSAASLGGRASESSGQGRPSSLRATFSGGASALIALKKLLTVEDGAPTALDEGARDSQGQYVAPNPITPARARRGSAAGPALAPNPTTPARSRRGSAAASLLTPSAPVPIPDGRTRATTEGGRSLSMDSNSGGAGKTPRTQQATASFTASIFASGSDRRRLKDWVQSHYPQLRQQYAASVQAPAAPTTDDASYGAVDTQRATGGVHTPARHSGARRVLSRLEVTKGGDGDASSDEDADRETTKSPIGSSRRSGDFELTPSTTRAGQDTSGYAGGNAAPQFSSVVSDQVTRQDTLDPAARADYRSTREELLRLRGQHQRGMGGAKLRSSESGRDAALREWMYSAKDIAPHERAAVLIQFARDGEERSIFASPRGLACFRLRTGLAPLFRVCSFLFALLKFFERPLWTYYHDHWHNNDIFPVSGVPQASVAVTGAIKLPLLLVLMFGLALELGYKESSLAGVFQRVNIMRTSRHVLFLYCVAQAILVIIALSGGPPTLLPISSLGGILYVLWFNRRSLHKLRIVLRVLPKLTVVLVVFLLLVVLLAACGPYLFNLKHSGEDDDMHQVYFDSFRASAWSVFVAITTSNYPNQIMPAYRSSREAFLYVLAFVCLGAFTMLNLVLVTVLVEFQKASQLSADIQKASRTVLLLRAFEVLDPEGKGYVERAQVQLLLDELYKHYADFRKAGVPRGTARDILIDILDVDGDGRISVQDFLYFVEVTRIKVREDGGETYLERRCPGLVASAPFRVLRSVVDYPYFNLVVDTVTAALILVSVLVNYDHTYQQTASSVGIDYTLIEVLCFEALVKIAVWGWSKYKASFRNKIDFLIAFGALASLIGALSYADAGQVNGFTILMRVLLMFRLFIYPRNLRYVLDNRRIKRIGRLLRRILSKIATLGIVFLCIGYFFASLGLLFFGGLINRSPEHNPRYDDLINSRYGRADFYPLNFNDFGSACITLFACLQVSDFDTVASGFTATSGGHAKVYFALWYVVGVLLMLNILKSFFLGEFLALFLVPSYESVPVGDGIGDDHSVVSTEGESGGLLVVTAPALMC